MTETIEESVGSPEEKVNLSLEAMLENMDPSATIEVIKCSICKNWVPRMIVRKHTEEHFENFVSNHMCDHCGRNFRDSNALRLHSKIHGEKTFQCQYCDKKFFSKTSLNTHESAKHTKKGHRFCDTCGESFSTGRGLESHMKAAHDIENRFQCKLCQRYFLTEDGFKAHEAQQACKSYYCAPCDRYFTCMSKLRKHEQNHSWHEQNMNKAFPCNLCSKSFTRLTRLTEHIRKVHDNPDPDGENVDRRNEAFVCHCGKSFAKETTFMKHRQTHIMELQQANPTYPESMFQMQHSLLTD